MDFFTVIDTRYSYRGSYTTEKISRENIDRILTAAIAAPQGMHIHTNKFVAVTDEKLIAELGEVIKMRGARTAPLVLVLLTEDKNTPINFEVENYCASAENIQLAATALGYATVWTDGILRTPKMNDGVRRVLNIPQKYTIRAVMPIGVPENPKGPLEKSSIDELVVFDKF